MRRLGFLLTSCALFAAAGCNAYRLEPPSGFAEVNKRRDGAQMIAGDKVGLNVQVLGNVRGGTLSFWGTELVNKLGDRGYALEGQAPVKSKNGVAGTRFDFAYTNPDGEEKFYSAILFTTNKHRVVVQVAGDAEHANRYRTQLDTIAGDTIARGCRAKENLCRSAQPPKLYAPKAKKPEAEEAPTDQRDALADGDAPPTDG